jgi:hypothetical protein
LRHWRGRKRKKRPIFQGFLHDARSIRLRHRCVTRGRVASPWPSCWKLAAPGERAGGCSDRASTSRPAVSSGAAPDQQRLTNQAEAHPTGLISVNQFGNRRGGLGSGPPSPAPSTRLMDQPGLDRRGWQPAPASCAVPPAYPCFRRFTTAPAAAVVVLSHDKSMRKKWPQQQLHHAAGSANLLGCSAEG